MQIRAVTILLLTVSLLCAGEKPPNLLREWQNPGNGKVLLPQWRFRDWGRGSSSVRRSSGKKKTLPSKVSLRSHQVRLSDGKVQVILENPDEALSSNMFFRSLTLPENGVGSYCFRAVMVNGTKKRALVRISLTASGGGKNFTERRYFSVSETPSAVELPLTLPVKCSALQISLLLLGPGKVSFSELQLTAEPVPAALPGNIMCRGSLTLPEKTPVEFPLILPAGFKFSQENTILVTLPWGVRLINCRGAHISGVKVKVREKTETTLVIDKKHAKIYGLSLLLSSDLPESEKTLMGSVQLQTGKEKGENCYFEIRCVRDMEFLAPRHFTFALSANGTVPARESAPALENALLRSGANILVTPRQLLSLRQLRTAKISQRAFLTAHAVKAENHCYYSMLRDESFWEKYYLPLLSKQVLRPGGRHIEAVMCGSFLGQHRAIHCLCSLCRVELCDFLPKLPPKDIMNCSAGLLEARYGRELQKFRTARLRALWAGARLYLPVNARGFSRRPALIPVYQVSQILTGKCHVSGNESVVDLTPGHILPDGKKYDPAVNFLVRKLIVKRFREYNLPRNRLTGRLAVRSGVISPEELQFELLNLFFSGFSGVWLEMKPGTDYSFRVNAGSAAMILREYENYFRKAPLEQHQWILQSSAAPLELPPVPGPAGYPLDLPRAFSPLKLLVWRHGNNTLAAVGNFAAESLRCNLRFPAAPLMWQGNVNGGSLSGLTLRRSGIDLTIPPRAWRFLEFEKL